MMDEQTPLRERESGSDQPMGDWRFSPAELTGTDVRGTIRMSEDALNDLLARTMPVPFSIEVGPDNRVVVRQGAFYATAVLDRTIEVEGGAPRVSITLASFVIALALRHLFPRRGVHVRGRRVTIDLGAFPELRVVSGAWQYLRAASVTTSAGAVDLHFHIAITE